MPRTRSAKAELFIVEGDSAGGSAQAGPRPRCSGDRSPARQDPSMSNAPVSTGSVQSGDRHARTALGTGDNGDFDIAKLRYHKIIIMTGADVDGSHIRTLLLTFFYRHLPQIVEGSFLIAQPPLCKVKRGQKERYQGRRGARKLSWSPPASTTVRSVDVRRLEGELATLVDHARITQHGAQPVAASSTNWSKALALAGCVRRWRDGRRDRR
ncbi:MAG: toprim domain-containing protein [Geminicoccaceae bacterium]